jgi:hypothetical protein
VEQLGRVEELLAAHDHLPMRVEAHVAHQRHERVEDLRDPTPEGGRADVQDALPLQVLRQLTDLVDQAAPGQVGVVRQRLAAERYLLKHEHPVKG